MQTTSKDIYPAHTSVTWNTRDGYIKGKSYNIGPDADLIVFPWPETIEEPSLVLRGGYHRINLGLQPRVTKCYGESYTYSGRKHPAEEHTPKKIKDIMEFTESMYEYPDATTMCLANYYPSCYHNIGLHSDDEAQFGDIPDVVCWVLGGENRRLIIRDQSNKVVISAHLSNCIYIMHGPRFQTDFKHEIPKEYGALFKRMSELAPSDLSTLSKADWLLANPDIGSEYQGYDDWATPRTSFTIRFFS